MKRHKKDFPITVSTRHPLSFTAYDQNSTLKFLLTKNGVCGTHTVRVKRDEKL